jgi:diguanylate cyclase (GGDEF)-like protein
LAVPGVREEACVPLHAGGRTVGVISVESEEALPEDCLDTLSEVADALSARLADLGVPAEERAMRRLARHAVQLAGMTSWNAAVDVVLDAALDLSGMSTAVLAVRDRPESPDRLDRRADAQVPSRWRICGAVGPLMGSLASLRGEDLSVIAGWVDVGTSCYTTGRTEGRGLVGHERLRARGAESLVVVPLDVLGRRVGILLVADDAVHSPSTDTAERLELLGALAAGTLRTLDAVRELSDMATRDPLTGLGHHGRFYDDLRAMMARHAPERVSVLLLDVDRFKAVNDARGHLHGDELLRRTAKALLGSLRSNDRAYRIGGDEFAALAPVRSAEQARTIADRVLTAVRAAIQPVTASLGYAVHDFDQTAEQLVARADAEMFAAKRAGRDTARGGTTAFVP